MNLPKGCCSYFFPELQIYSLWFIPQILIECLISASCSSRSMRFTSEQNRQKSLPSWSFNSTLWFANLLLRRRMGQGSKCSSKCMIHRSTHMYMTHSIGFIWNTASLVTQIVTFPQNLIGNASRVFAKDLVVNCVTWWIYASGPDQISF